MDAYLLAELLGFFCFLESASICQEDVWDIVPKSKENERQAFQHLNIIGQSGYFFLSVHTHKKSFPLQPWCFSRTIAAVQGRNGSVAALSCPIHELAR
jgi:hypothetical protein